MKNPNENGFESKLNQKYPDLSSEPVKIVAKNGYPQGVRHTWVL